MLQRCIDFMDVVRWAFYLIFTRRTKGDGTCIVITVAPYMETRELRDSEEYLNSLRKYGRGDGDRDLS
jgi:hypothetical protein